MTFIEKWEFCLFQDRARDRARDGLSFHLHLLSITNGHGHGLGLDTGKNIPNQVCKIRPIYTSLQAVYCRRLQCTL